MYFGSMFHGSLIHYYASGIDSFCVRAVGS